MEKEMKKRVRDREIEKEMTKMYYVIEKKIMRWVGPIL